MLKQALAVETDAMLFARYSFYLAQSRRDSSDAEGALDLYLRRADLGHWAEEVFVALLEAAQLMERLRREPDAVLAIYARATAAVLGRAEAAHGAARLCRALGRWVDGYGYATSALLVTAPADGLFVELWVNDYGLLDEYAVAASWTGRYADARDCCRLLLTRPGLPANDRARIAGNLHFIEQRLADGRAAWGAGLPGGGWRPERPLGGTELLLEGLRKRLGAEADAVNLCVTSYAVVDERPLVVWIQHDIDQYAVQWLDDPSRTGQVSRFVFVSDWQRQRFLDRFGLPRQRCTVIRNATEVPALDRPWAPGRPLKLAYASTPYRGLAVLLDAWALLDEAGQAQDDLPERELHVWSSHKLYGPSADDAVYGALYARARALPGVHYHGIAPSVGRLDLFEEPRALA